MVLGLIRERLGPLHLRIYINDMFDDISSNLFLFADDSLLLDEVVSPTVSADKLNCELMSSVSTLLPWLRPHLLPWLRHCMGHISRLWWNSPAKIYDSYYFAIFRISGFSVAVWLVLYETLSLQRKSTGAKKKTNKTNKNKLDIAGPIWVSLQRNNFSVPVSLWPLRIDYVSWVTLT